MERIPGAWMSQWKMAHPEKNAITKIQNIKDRILKGLSFDHERENTYLTPLLKTCLEIEDHAII